MIYKLGDIFKMKSKKEIILIVVSIIVLAGTGFYIKSVADKQDNQTGTNMQSKIKKPGEIAKEPTKYINKDVIITGRLLQDGPSNYIIVDEGVKSSAAITLDFSKTTIDPKKYTNAPSSPPTESTPTLTTLPSEDKSAEGDKLAEEAEQPKIPKGVIVVKGKLTQNKANTPLVLIVTSAE